MKILIIVWKVKPKYENSSNGPFHLTVGLVRDPDKEYYKILKTEVGERYEFLTWFLANPWQYFVGVFPFIHDYGSGLK